MSLAISGDAEAHRIQAHRMARLAPTRTVTPVLEVVTRTLPDRVRRPLDLHGHWVHTLLVDPHRSGVPASHVRLRHHEPWADFVWVLDDDDRATEPDLPALLSPGVDAHVFRVYFDEFGEAMPLPHDWDTRTLEFSFVSPSNLVVSRDLWMRTREAWGEHYDGDWPWIRAVAAESRNERWVDRVIAAIDEQHHGR